MNVVCNTDIKSQPITKAPAVTKAFPKPAYDGLVLPYETGGTDDNLNNKVGAAAP